MDGDNETTNCTVPIESIHSCVKTPYRENESEAVNITPNRNRSDSSRNVVLTPPKTDTPREYESTYIFEDSMTEDLDLSPVLDRTFSLDSDDGVEEGENNGEEIVETSFTISKARKNDLGVDKVGKGISQVCLIEEEEEDDDEDEDYTSDFININMNNGDENVFNLSIIYEENSFDLNCSGGFDDN